MANAQLTDIQLAELPEDEMDIVQSLVSNSITTMGEVAPLYDEPEVVASSGTESPTPAEDSDDDSKSWIAILIGCIVGIFLVGMVGYAFVHRKRTVKWGDVGEVQRTNQDDTAKRIMKEELETEMINNEIGGSSLNSEPNDVLL